MRGSFTKVFSISVSILLLFILVSCGSKSAVTTNSPIPASSPANEKKIVNLYTDRHYEADQKLLDEFTSETGIQVNVVSGKSDELLERLIREGQNTPADVFITTDAGRLHVAKEKQMLKPVSSSILTGKIPENLRDKDNEWFGLTMRARVIVYAKDRVKPSELSTYEDLAGPKWKGRVLVRPSSNLYNQSLVASFIELKGEEETLKWAKGLVSNLARAPKGNDQDQATAVVAGVGDVAIVNTYYIGLMLNSSNPEVVSTAKKIGVFFPNQTSTGTHVNISGAGITKYAKNTENGIRLLEFLSGEKAQGQFAATNYEYPVNPKVQPTDLLRSWGEFKHQNISLNKLGENNIKAVKLMNEAGWK